MRKTLGMEVIVTDLEAAKRNVDGRIDEYLADPEQGTQTRADKVAEFILDFQYKGSRDFEFRWFEATFSESDRHKVKTDYERAFVEFAWRDRNWFDGMRLAVLRMLERRSDLGGHPDYRGWLLDFLKGEEPPKRKGGRRAESNYHRNCLIYGCVQELSSEHYGGMPVGEAIEYVAERLRMNPDTVRKVVYPPNVRD